jgi:hypothetical protein
MTVKRIASATIFLLGGRGDGATGLCRPRLGDGRQTVPARAEVPGARDSEGRRWPWATPEVAFDGGIEGYRDR